MSEQILTLPGYQRPFTVAQMKQARDQALAKAKASYEAERRQILHDYRVMMENSGHLPAKREDVK